MPLARIWWPTDNRLPARLWCARARGRWGNIWSLQPRSAIWTCMIPDILSFVHICEKSTSCVIADVYTCYVTWDDRYTAVLFSNATSTWLVLFCSRWKELCEYARQRSKKTCCLICLTSRSYCNSVFPQTSNLCEISGWGAAPYNISELYCGSLVFLH